MKKHILAIAFVLIERNGKTSNKEIKDALHRVFANDPTFQLSQTEVSTCMDELYNAMGLRREINKTIPGITYFDYSIDPQFQAAYAQTTTPPNTPSVKQQLNDSSAPGSNTASIGTGTVITPLDPSIAFTAHISGLPTYFAQGATKNEAKKNCFQRWAHKITSRKITYNHLNASSTKHFKKKYN